MDAHAAATPSIGWQVAVERDIHPAVLPPPPPPPPPSTPTHHETTCEDNVGRRVISLDRHVIKCNKGALASFSYHPCKHSSKPDNPYGGGQFKYTCLPHVRHPHAPHARPAT
uniref:Uncharacterized protein n=1 Tax=Calcidiscus leptoporus TaxID=127549 RepID=A0A7S0JL00_9EUKA